MDAKPKVRLIGTDGNIFALLALCSRALKKAGRLEEARLMQERVFKAASYAEALSIMGEYVEIE